MKIWVIRVIRNFMLACRDLASAAGKQIRLRPALDSPHGEAQSSILASV